MRSLATRRQHLATSAVLADVVAFLRAAGFDLVLVETAGHRPERLRDRRSRRPAHVRDDDRVRRGEPAREDRHARLRRLDRAQQVREARRRGRAARRAQAVAAQPRRVRRSPTPRCRCSRRSRASSTIRASTGCSWRCARSWSSSGGRVGAGRRRADLDVREPKRQALIPAARTALSRRDRCRRTRHRPASKRSARQARAAHGSATKRCAALGDAELPAPLEPLPRRQLQPPLDAVRCALQRRARRASAASRRAARGLAEAPRQRHRRASTATRCADAKSAATNYREHPQRPQVPKVAAPQLAGWGDLLRFLLSENLPGRLSVHGGVFPYRREDEDPTRMFAGEGTPERTNRRFHYLADGPAGDAALDRVRLRDALRRGPRRAARHLRQGRQLGRVDRDARRREEALLGLRPLRARRPPSR